jgi:hypothetical protein
MSIFVGMTRLRRALRTRPGEDGFTVIEFAMATGVMLAAIVAMLYTTLAGFRGIATARRRQAATALANQAVEQVRALRFQDLQNGLGQSDLVATTDSAIDKSGAPTVYKYAGEQIPFSTITGGPAPLVPHQQQVTRSNLVYTVSSYLTYYQNDLTANAFRLTVVVTWPPFRGGSGQVTVQTILYSPTCGSSGSSTGTGLHPFSAPCQAFLYGNASVQAGQVNMSSADPNVPLDYAALWLPNQTSGSKSEQVQAVSGTAQTAGISLKLKSDTSETCTGRQQASSSATNDPGQPGAVAYQVATQPTAVVCSGTGNSLTDAWGAGNSSRVTVSYVSGDTASTMSTVKASATNTCPLATPTSPFDLPQADSQPCGNSKGTQSGSLSGVLSVDVQGQTLNNTLATVGPSTTASGSFTNQDATAETNVCKTTSGDGCVQSQQYRALGTVVLIQPPVGSTLLPSAALPGYDSTKGMVRLTGYADSASAEAGIGASAPATTISAGTIDYYNGAGYSTMSVTSTRTQIQFGLQGAGVHYDASPLLKLDITGDLWTGGASVSDPAPANCGTTCTRTQASATVNSPIVGSFTYTITYAGVVAASITTSIDLGTMQAQSSYKAAPTGA